MVFRPESIDSSLKALNQWDCYKLEIVDGKKTKIPYSPSTGQRASSTDLRTWTSFNAASAAYQDMEIYDGICFFVTEESGIVFIDLDDCIKDGEIEPWALEIVKMALVSSLRGYPPSVAVEFARKLLFSDVRPAFADLEAHLRGNR